MLKCLARILLKREVFKGVEHGMSVTLKFEFEHLTCECDVYLVYAKFNIRFNMLNLWTIGTSFMRYKSNEILKSEFCVALSLMTGEKKIFMR